MIEVQNLQELLEAERATRDTELGKLCEGMDRTLDTLRILRRRLRIRRR